MDLDGDGIELTALAGSYAFFDLDSDGYAEQTGWVGADDGILAIDSNGNGRIDDINEVFGNATTDGFTELAALDSNADGVIDSNDTQFGDLRVWIDADQDGFTDQGELNSLGSLGIASINLGATPTGTYDQGNLISHVSSFTRTDSTTSEIVDVWFANDQVNTRYTGEYELDEAMYFLPTLRGYGEVADLHIAASLDSSLLDMLPHIAFSDLSDFRDYETRVEDMIVRWAGADAVVPGSRGQYVDARHLAVVEAFMGQNFVQFGTGGSDPGWASGDVLEGIWDTLFGELQARLLVQGPLAGLFPDVTYLRLVDTFAGTADFTAAVSSMAQSAPAETGEAAQYWIAMIATLDAVAGDLGVAPITYDGAVDSAMATAGLDFTAAGLRDTHLRLGTTGADNLMGTDGINLFDGDTGNDHYDGREGADTYLFGAGSGQDDIFDVDLNDGTIDVVRMGAGITPGDVTVSRGGSGNNDLVFDLAATGDRLTVTWQFVNNDYGIEEVHFADGTVWTEADIWQMLQTGTPGADNLYGSNTTDDFLDGGAGNDYLEGRMGSDTYVFGLGYDQDEVFDYDYTLNGVDVLQIVPGVAPSDVTLSRGGSGSNDLIIQIDGTTDQMTVTRQFMSRKYGLEEIQFSDGTVWTWSDLIDLLLAGTPGDDNLYGTDFTDDVFDGGAGNDYLEGRMGSDTYVFGLGYDQDEVFDYDYTLNGVDVLQVVPGVAPSDVTLSRGGSGNDDLIIQIDGTTDQMTVTRQFKSSQYGVEEVQFSDGTVWTRSDLIDMLLTGTPGDDNLYGSDSTDDVLDGGAGNDYLEGRKGSDTYVFGYNYDQDTVFDYPKGTNNVDVVQFNPDVSPLDVTLSRAGSGNYDLVFNLAGSSDTLAVSWQFWSSYYGVEEARFDDGTVWDEAMFLAMMPTGGAGGDALTGTAYSDVMTGLAGDDTLSGLAGNDIVDGGIGNDTLTGGADDDTFIFRTGDGVDAVLDFVAGLGTEDVLDLSGTAYADAATALANASQVGSDTVIDLGGSDSITLVGVNLGDVHQDDFMFA